MRGIGGSHGVGLPDIHFVAASAIFTRSSIHIIFGGLPSLDIGL
jgi:hypothetical protein